MKQFLGGKVTLFGGDSRDVLKDMPDNCIDSIVTDPPYALVSIVKRFGKAGSAPAKGNEAFMRASRGFMGKEWDTGEVAFDPEFWTACMRVLKPGGHLLSFGGTRTYHRMTCAIEDAGFEIRDTITWNFGSGFPKSHNIGRKMDESETRCSCNSMRDMRQDGASAPMPDQENQGDVLHQQLQEQDLCESAATTCIKRQRKAAPGKGVEGVIESGLEGWSDLSETSRELRIGEVCSMPDRLIDNGQNGRLCDGTPSSHDQMDRETADKDGMCAPSGPQSTQQRSDQFGTVARQSKPQNDGTWEYCGRCGKPIVPDGLGTALKPAMELICLARKPLSEKTVAANVLKWGTGAINIDGCRVGTEERHNASASSNEIYGQFKGTENSGRAAIGRFPANVITDGSDEVVAAFPVTGASSSKPRNNSAYKSVAKGAETAHVTHGHDDNGGSAARFFYQAKANKKDRANSKHPTVKPIKLLRYLIRLITPPNGVVLDPFAGSGTTGEAAYMEGCRAILIERETEYQEDISNRLRALDNIIDRSEDEIDTADSEI